MYISVDSLLKESAYIKQQSEETAVFVCNN